ncbi:MAG: hypothetical protein R3F54_11110 [Alphaproteobacteria bacterium]
MILLLAGLLYLGLGAGLGIVTLCIPALRRKMMGVAAALGMSSGYAQAVWLGGTLIAWPIGLYVFAAGRLLLVAPEKPHAALGKEIPSEEQGAPLLR